MKQPLDIKIWRGKNTPLSFSMLIKLKESVTACPVIVFTAFNNEKGRG